ncbi:MAG TPA: hypothetical protein VKA74_09275 [Myxococcota bacterium]|nr:hypothetical protein [Myxococcota bacterium]
MRRNHDPESVPGSAFFEGFAWPVPRAFAAALGAPRFEQGDVLHLGREGYEALGREMPSGLRAIQVLEPSRSARASEPEGDRRRQAWESEVRLEIIELDSGRSELCVTTQGKLFTALWRGDEAWLDADREPPPVPRSARDLHAALESTREVFAARELPAPRRKGCRFLYVVDTSSDASCAKATMIEDALNALGKLEAITLAPVETGIEAADLYHPALEIRGLFVSRRSEEAVHEALRAVLYGGSGESRSDDGVNATEEETTPSDRFSLARHGLLDAF